MLIDHIWLRTHPNVIAAKRRARDHRESRPQSPCRATPLADTVGAEGTRIEFVHCPISRISISGTWPRKPTCATASKPRPSSVQRTSSRPEFLPQRHPRPGPTPYPLFFGGYYQNPCSAVMVTASRASACRATACTSASRSLKCVYAASARRDAGLIDRYHLLVFPLLLGAGKRLFSTTDKDGMGGPETAARRVPGLHQRLAAQRLRRRPLIVRPAETPDPFERRGPWHLPYQPRPPPGARPADPLGLPRQRSQPVDVLNIAIRLQRVRGCAPSCRNTRRQGVGHNHRAGTSLSNGRARSRISSTVCSTVRSEVSNHNPMRGVCARSTSSRLSTVKPS